MDYAYFAKAFNSFGGTVLWISLVDLIYVTYSKIIIEQFRYCVDQFSNKLNKSTIIPSNVKGIKDLKTHEKLFGTFIGILRQTAKITKS